jgi:hypothetical protein
MTTPKLLSREELEKALRGVTQADRPRAHLRDLLVGHIAALEADNAARQRLGGQMANVCFNLGQGATSFTEREREIMRDLQRQWDALGANSGAALMEEHREALAAAERRHETTRATMHVREEALYADSNAKAFTQAFCETAEAAIQHAEAPRGGQHVPFHGDFHNLQPSALGRLRWWAKCGRAALKGEAAPLLVRARNEGLEKAAAKADATAERAEQKVARERAKPRPRKAEIQEALMIQVAMSSLAATIRALKEPEE